MLSGCSTLLALCVVVLAECAPPGPGLPSDRLAADDECAAPSDEACAVHALQRRGVVSRRAVEWPSAPSPAPESHGADMLQVDAQDTGVWHYARNCWDHCGKAEGFCEQWCGPGNACCHYYDRHTPECQDVKFWPVVSFHTCVSTKVKPPDPDAGTTPLPPPPEGCADIDPMCEPWAAQGECASNPPYMTLYCKKACGKCGADAGAAAASQEAAPATEENAAPEVATTVKPETTQEPAEPQRPSVPDPSGQTADCQDSNPSCYIWATQGQCKTNPAYMSANCKHSCVAC